MRARAELEKVAAVAPDDYITQYQLYLALDQLKLPDQAAAHKKLARRIAPRFIGLQIAAGSSESGPRGTGRALPLREPCAAPFR